MWRIACVACLLLILSLAPLRGQQLSAGPAPAQPASGHKFEISGGKFLLDGKPFTIIAGEMHYPRIPRAYWRHRLKMAKAMGLNAITTYVFWNVHEPKKGKFRFSGEADLAEFIRIAQQEGLYVLLRPGPYVCAEWEFGGFPYWLLNEKTGGKETVIRSADPNFLRYAERYLKEVGRRCAPLQIDRGGNILMVQVENEYGSFGADHDYMGKIRDAVRNAGFTVPLFTADGPSQMPAGHIDGALPGLNGVGSPELVRVIDRFQRGGPYLAPEIYPGWLDHWGEPFFHSNPASGAKTLDWFARNGYSISLYMFHGGTNFGFMNGANFGANFEPHTTTYDYSAPLDEAGRPTEQYIKIREALKALLPAGSLPEVPPANPIIALPKVELRPAQGVLDGLPAPVRSEHVLPMETIGQDYGYILYRTRIQGPMQDRLSIKSVRDYAVVMVNGKPVGTLDRRRRQQALTIDVPPGAATLDILVENCGRINYGPLLRDNHKGITEAVMLGDVELKGWEIYSLPMENPHASPAGSPGSAGPQFYTGTFPLNAVGDTFLDMRGWSKGAVWVNGHALGRYWSIGPQQTLYLPGPWLKRGENRIVVFEMLGAKSPVVAGLTEPILDHLNPEPPIAAHPARPRLGSPPAPSESSLAAKGDFADEDNAQTIRFARRTAQYICLQSTSAFDSSDFASCAELFLLDDTGKPLGRNRWRIVYADSEEQAQEDGSADNLIDGDESTLWHSAWSKDSTRHPHTVVIDLGEVKSCSGFRYVPRPGKKPGKIKSYRFYTSAEPFGARHP
jgi:beta-galactosidase